MHTGDGPRKRATAVLRCPVVVLAVLHLLAWSTQAQPASAQTASRANAPRDAASPIAELNHALVSFSGGAARFRLPSGWQVAEVPVGREIRLMVTPGPPPKRIEELADGFWISYQYRSATEAPPVEEMLQSMPRRLARAAGNEVRAEPPMELTLGGRPAIRQDFRRDASGQPDEIRGYHVLARTQQGLFELHMVAPSSAYETRADEVRELLTTLSLQSPQLATPKLSPELQPAAPLIGSWKALANRLILSGEGRVTIEFDGKVAYALDAEGRYDYSRKLTRLSGGFSADGDLLSITWDDGSRLNYRWRVSQGKLYLTDHFGRVSQLARLFP